MLYGLSQFLQCVPLDLSHAFARNTVMQGQLLERRRLVHQPALIHDVAFAVIQHAPRIGQLCLSAAQILAPGQEGSPAISLSSTSQSCHSPWLSSCMGEFRL